MAELVSGNTVLWRDCFEGLSADLRLKYEPGEFHSDVILRERLDPALLRRLGFAPESLRLEVWHEFFEVEPPTRDTIALKREDDAAQREAMAEPDLLDEAMAFGDFRLASGKAFVGEEDTGKSSIGVGKQWMELDGRQFLVESCDWVDLEPLMERLPTTDLQAALESGQINGITMADRTPPCPPVGTRIHDEILLAQNGLREEPGVVLDYVAVPTSISDFVFSNETFHVSGTVSLSSSVTFEGGAVIKHDPGTKLRILSGTTVNCQTDPYRPVVITARDDTTVGASVPGETTLSGFYANPALEVSSPSADFDNFRVLYATVAIDLKNGYGYPGPFFRNLQVVNCQTGFKAYGAGNIKVLNALFCEGPSHSLSEVFSGIFYTSVQAEHLTVNGANWFNYNPSSSSMNLVNSLLVGVAYPGSYSGTNVALESDASTVFEETGGGHHYLRTGSEHRNAGVTSIDADLAEALKDKTTYSPVLYSTPITEDTEFEPVVWRDVDDPDLGYHYDPIDLAICDLQATAATVTLTNGVVLGTYGQNGFWLQSGATLTSGGRPDEKNHIARFNTVMEQPENWGNGSANFVTVNPYDTATGSTVSLRFTDLEQLASTGYHTYANKSGWNIADLTIQDCALFGGQLHLGGPSTMTIELKNSLFLSVNTWLSDDHQLSAYNNLFRRGWLTLFPYVSSWVLRDNVFDNCQIGDMCFIGTPTHSHNAYVNTTGRILTAATGDITLSSLAYESSDLGDFYQPSAATVLKDAGSRTAGQAGMAQHTATAALQKDAGAVDIGLHYVATISDKAVDTDGDGLADYEEDVDGDGSSSGETSLVDYDSDDDGIGDGAELHVTVTDPLDYDTKNNGTPDGDFAERFAIFQPLYVDICSPPVQQSTPVTGGRGRTSESYYIPKGTDVIHVQVQFDNNDDSDGRGECDDLVAFTISSPVLPTISESYYASDLPDGVTHKLALGPDLINVHNKLKETDSYVNITVTAAHGSDAPYDHFSAVTVGLGAFRVELAEVRFEPYDETNFPGGNHTMLSDDGSEVYSAPHWSAGNDPLGLQWPPVPPEVKVDPLCFTSGRKMRLKRTTYAIQPNGFNVAVYGRGVNSDGYHFVDPLPAFHDNDELRIGDLDCVQALTSSKVDYLDPLQVTWEFRVDGLDDWIEAGASENPVYVTLADPMTANLYRTVLHLACSKKPSATGPESAFANTWSFFEGRQVQTWDETPLTYYSSPDVMHGDTPSLLLYHDAQCGGFATLFADSLRANGLSEIYITLVRPPLGHSMFGVKNIEFKKRSYSFPYRYATVDLDLSPAGIPGQNKPSPAWKIFGEHFLVRQGFSTAVPHYDPSYGLYIQDEAAFSGHVKVWMRESDERWADSDEVSLEVRFENENY